MGLVVGVRSRDDGEDEGAWGTTWARGGGAIVA